MAKFGVKKGPYSIVWPPLTASTVQISKKIVEWEYTIEISTKSENIFIIYFLVIVKLMLYKLFHLFLLKIKMQVE
jgi:hypothetical protein